jgi:trk system potassium uptake protein TrkA
MGRFLVIGLGNFGIQMLRTLYEHGHEVVGVDRSKDKVELAGEFSSRCVLADAEDKEFLETVGAGEMDAVVVSMGDNVSQSIITTLLLKEVGARHIISKANGESHGRALTKVGAHKVVYPEKEAAMKLARQLTNPSMIDFLDLSGEYVMTELLPPVEFAGKSLAELNLRRDFDVLVVAVRESVPEKFTLMPPAEFIIKDSDVLIMLGKADDIARLEKMRD